MWRNPYCWVLFSTMLGEFSLFLDLSGLGFPICGAQSTVQSCPFPPQTLPFVNRRTGKAFTAESHFLSVWAYSLFSSYVSPTAQKAA